MNQIKLSFIALLTISSLAMAGGDISPITPYELEDTSLAENNVVKEIVPPVVVAPVVAPKPVADVSGIYAGFGIVAARYDTNCNCNTNKSGVDKTAGVMARVGYDFNQYVGVEARGMMTTLKDNGGTVKHAGVFVKPMYPVSDAINVYGLGGVAKTTTQGTLRRTDVTGLAFGAGLEYDLSADTQKEARYDRDFDGIADQEKGLGLFVDYERLYYKSGSPDLDVVSVGVTYDF
ncbi:MAG: hypothetical protein KU29_07800 [Sulfurovum sp. FS06-10]|nr:MAG: hypothetical protein KU29_07800 [Sulfurovum sp. FS06-10]